MVVKVNTIAGPAGGKEHQLCISTQDAGDVPLLQELFDKAPVVIKANIHIEKQGDFAGCTLYWNWQRSESKQ